ncbi:MBL fold metallo-hydrolase [Paraburkholderia rhizosphaerae]|uniref:Glyoxylase-like metal-dependent hydrolase (Beta-lactamase superfamily II) n=1 Tax=Paraburkholderia rhizosphaerae TaxID=480658 RepID=A0A4R8LWF5_9BURK|nr:MBL fold metallo-hydrolase [Paraburkholderia rhizosphaerae]TDY52263.1 glyoxylase-like metal-dependent hydrolase (beta-lactamase superfamily II) [Paraburkholderia rhizosphaerae]
MRDALHWRKRWAGAVSAVSVALFAGMTMIAASVAAERNAHPADTRFHAPVPIEIAPGVYVMFGSGDAVAPANHGVVANNGFIVGTRGVTVIDTGSSYRYGRAMLDAIRKVTSLPVELVVITHQGPEFVFGASAFRDQGVPILAQRRTAELIRERCAICLKNLTRTLGEDEMAGSRVTVPDRTIDATTQIESGGRSLHLLVFGPASTPGDLAVLDPSTGVLFAGGLVSVGRIPEFRNENISGWLDALDKLKALDAKAIVPAFGRLARPADLDRLAQYLRGLDAAVRDAFSAGIGLTQAMHDVRLPAFRHDKLYRVAQPQNVEHLYLQLEKEKDKVGP